MANILANIDGWDIIPANNQPDGLDPMTVVDDLRQIQATVKKYLASKGSNIASSATVDLSTATGSYIEVTGTTTITSFGTIGQGVTKLLKFTGALQLTYNATSMILPTSANLTTEAGDTALFISLGSGNWQCLMYQRVSGQSIINLSKASQLEAETGTDDAKYITALKVKQSITSELTTQVNAEAGLVNDELMTPLRTKQAITANAGRVLKQYIVTATNLYDSTTSIFTGGDNIPQQSGGGLIFSTSVTPTNASSILEFEIEIWGGETSNVAEAFIAALFVDSTANSLAHGYGNLVGVMGAPSLCRFKYELTAGSTSARTYKIKAGLDGIAGTFNLNGTGGNRKGGGSLYSRMTIKEYLP